MTIAATQAIETLSLRAKHLIESTDLYYLRSYYANHCDSSARAVVGDRTYFDEAIDREALVKFQIERKIKPIAKTRLSDLQTHYNNAFGKDSATLVEDREGF